MKTPNESETGKNARQGLKWSRMSLRYGHEELDRYNLPRLVHQKNGVEDGEDHSC